ncbi:sensor histidine kinase [Pseudoalteromonas sp. BSi20652]|uniref:sensor histidine kinase n=1 Tax=Pseudoalteromonas sp. BSi20652 TaxID=388384 RepID=UPI000231B02E|nr:HAMP domain-containing sensor histidine kinase [Pseudoalteromonas sp. BSi20652]GAA59015.1 sensor histidine kinase [Pseudoalteromonas sp. BSi20652]
MNQVDNEFEYTFLDERTKRQAIELRLHEKTMALGAVTKKLQQKEAELACYKNMLVQSTKMATLGILSVDAASEMNTPLSQAINNVGSFNYASPIITSLLKINEQYLNGELKESQFKHELDLLNLQHPFVWIGHDLTAKAAESLNTLKKVNYCVQNLLNFSYSNESHGVQLVNIPEVAISMLKLLESQLHLCDIKTDLDSVLPLYCNLSSINQLFVNLLINAREACEDNDTKGSIIEVHVFERNNYICVEVKDNGCGMSNKVQEQMFDPFFTTKEGGKSSGMGLTLVQSIVQENTGKIEVNSTLGLGTTIKCLFPLKNVS